MKNLKKGIACMLTAALMISVVPEFPGSVARAATTAPSVTSYAEKEQLMTSFDLDGTNDTIGKIVFGKNESGNAQEWYIVGKDSGVAGDNMVLFAASWIRELSTCFAPDKNNKSYNPAWGCTYVTPPAEVCASHYGASNLRSELLDMTSESNSRYFTSAEKKLMNYTTITTEDILQETNYTTTDKLYAVSYKDAATKKIWVGSSDSMAIAAKYWGGDSAFYSRTPSDYSYTGAYLVDGKWKEIDGFVVTTKADIQPVFNLNLTSVLFCSSVPENSVSEAKGTIAGGTVMKLRMDGSATVSSTVYADKNSIRVYPAAGEKVTLVVQGNNGTDDWYYSKPVSGTALTLTSAEINAACDFLSGNPDFSACKIWIEKKGADGLIYAENPKKEIPSVAVTVAAPVGGQTLNTSATCTTAGVGKVSTVTWTPAAKNAAYSTKYTASVTLAPADGYGFSPVTTAAVNATAATATLNVDGTLTVTGSFNTDKAKINTQVKDNKNQAEYKITGNGETGGTVEYVKPVKTSAKTITIPATITVGDTTYKVTSIAKNAFKNNKNITKVTIGKNVKTIGAGAFYNCTKLKTVTMGNSVTTIGDKAFYKCKALTKITIPSKVSKIGKQAFYGCKKLKKITVKTKKLKKGKVGSKAFKGIYSKAVIKVPKSKYSVYKKLFKQAGAGKKAKFKKF